jgi:plastocyanin
MKAQKGDAVTFVDEDGKEHAATVDASYDGGARLYLRINASNVVKQDVRHEDDKERAHATYWKEAA